MCQHFEGVYRLRLLVAVSLVAIAVVVTVTSAPGAGATGVPAAHAAGFPSSINVTIPAGGDAQVTSPTLPPTATSLTVTATPAAGTSASAFASLAEVLAPLGSFKQRFLACLAIYAYPLPGESASFAESGSVLGLLFLNACIELAREVSAPRQARDAAAACRQLGRIVPAKLTRVGGRYKIRVNGVARAKRKLALTVTCTPIGGGIQLDVRARAPGVPLTRIVGPTLSIGYLSPSGSTASPDVHTAFAIP